MAVFGATGGNQEALCVGDHRATIPAPASPGALVLVAVALMAMGLVMVASATAPLDRPLVSAKLWQTPFGRQLLFVSTGLVVMLITAYAAGRLLASPGARHFLPLVFFVLVLLCLVGVFLPGLSDAHRGSQRWLRLGPGGWSFQPSEPAKAALVTFLALVLGRRQADPRSFWKGFLPAALAIGTCAGLVGAENLGTAVLLAAAGTLMLWVAGCRWRHLLPMAAFGAAGLTGLLFAEPYRLARLTAYTQLWSDPLGAGYQPLQSLTSIASGGWFGLGLGAGIQKYGYLPESHTDFVFSVICEETGLVGAGLVIALFCAWLWLGFRTMAAAPSASERLLAFGLTAIVGLQAAMNIAVVTVVTPTTGISLPLVSAGGSGMIGMSLTVGLLAAVAGRACKSCAADGAAELADGPLGHSFDPLTGPEPVSC